MGLTVYLAVKTLARGQYDIKYQVPRASVFMSYCPSVHVLTSIASIANALYIIKLLYNSTVSMVMDAILCYNNRVLTGIPLTQICHWIYANQLIETKVSISWGIKVQF